MTTPTDLPDFVATEHALVAVPPQASRIVTLAAIDELVQVAGDLITDLREMDDEGAIRIEDWPTVQRLIAAWEAVS